MVRAVNAGVIPLRNMNLDELLNEAQKLKRETILLRPVGEGEPAAIWYEIDDEELDRTNHICWLTVDTSYIPNFKSNQGGRYLTVFTNEEDCETGRIEHSDSWPDRNGLPLFAHTADILPPIDAIISRGSPAIDPWLAKHNWNRNERYDTGFGDDNLIAQYEDLHFAQYPVYQNNDTYAVLGGWHCPGPDDDWHELIDEMLCVLTIQNSEPWVETWQKRNGEFSVKQRTT